MARPLLSAAAVALALVACSSGDPAPVATSPAAVPTATTPATPTVAPSTATGVRAYPVPAGSRPHDVAVAKDGTVWYTAQALGRLGRLDPRTGQVREVPLGAGSSPHGVIVGPDEAAWVTDTGRNAMIRVDHRTLAVREHAMPRPGLGMHTAVFDQRGTLWFTGNAGWYGRLVLATGKVDVYAAPDGSGPYGITVTPDGTVWFASLTRHYVARVDPATGRATRVRPPTAGQGARRVWSDSRGRVWVSEWDAGQVAVYDPATRKWREWRLPGADPMAYAVYVDDEDVVWLSDFGADALVRFDPETEEFTAYPLPGEPGNVRQIHGCPGEVWGAESAANTLVVLRT